MSGAATHARRGRGELALRIQVAVTAVTLFAVGAPLAVVLDRVALPLALVLVLLQSGALLLTFSPRREVAVLAAALSAVATVVLAFLSVPDGTRPWPVSVVSMIAFPLALVLIGRREHWGLGALAGVVAVGGALVAGSVREEREAGVADLVVFAALTLVAVLLGVVLRAALDARVQLAREREISAAELARREIVEERTRIARDLHDVVAHGMSAIQVRAASARYRLPSMGEDAAREFDALAETAREGMAEMRRLLGVLRDDGAEAASAPQPGLAEIAGLLERAGQHGPVMLQERLSAAARAAVDPLTALTTYRIVQESLSNVARHAPGAAVRVLLEAGPGRELIVEVVNDAAPGRVAPVADAGGHGVRGMRERVAARGGRLEVGPRAEGGFRVWAALPFGRG